MVFAAPVIHKSVERVVGHIAPGERVKLHDVIRLGERLWRVSFVHERGRPACRKCNVEARLELLSVWAAPTTLTARDDAVLGVAALALTPSTLANRIHDLGLSDTRFHQILNGLLENREALERYPVVVNRLRRVRATRQRFRRMDEEG